jgi:hypothetical protein
MHPPTPLTFAAVDAIAFAPAAAPASVPAFHPALLGPLVELAILYAQETLGATDIGAVVKAHPLGSMFSARDANVVVQLSLDAGYLRLAGRFAPATELTRLSIVTKRGPKPAALMTARPASSRPPSAKCWATSLSAPRLRAQDSSPFRPGTGDLTSSSPIRA